MKERTKNQKGITLIALIITIVVLMILAAVAINSITNEGILSQAGSTANKYNQAVKDEESYLQDYEDMLTAANGGYKDKNFKVGDTVTVAGENFYVIEDKTSLGKVVLLAKGNIDTETLVQDGENNYTAFSKTNYWHTADIPTKNEWGEYEEPFDLTETGVPDESHYAARAAYDYGAKIGGKGRLMTYKEADDLSKTDFSTKLYETNFWLGSAGGTESVWLVDGGSSLLHGFNYLGDGIDFCGWRPVIEISKSKLS